LGAIFGILRAFRNPARKIMEIPNELRESIDSGVERVVALRGFL